MRVGLVGAGKRMLDVYAPILKALGEDVVGFVTRSNETAERFSASTGFKRKASFNELYQETPDYVIVCTPPSAVSSCVRQLLLKSSNHNVILIETPIEDFTLVHAAENAHATVGVLEQWPFLPLEQFKELLYQRNVLARPFLVKNDARSYDYHAIAQLRTYLGRKLAPMTVKGTQVIVPIEYNDNNERKAVNDAWDLAHVQFQNGAILCHEFSYACKIAPFRSIQTLRAYSTNGTIITGRIYDRSNDCEIIDIEILSDGNTMRLPVEVVKDEAGVISLIQTNLAALGDPISWKRLFKESRNDNETAVATHLLHMSSVVNDGADPLYPLKDASIDQYLMLGIKQACQQGVTLRLS